ncbi:hypothetical protein ABIA35_000058 [Catenulispora sp. MAP12-49]|uniref:Imm32 family immunity protein n=1 Tax=unclassified Catenulispora TaxID=414885 RepID=UPI0035170B0F
MTERHVEVPDYEPGGPLRFAWAEGFRIEVDASAGEVVVRANSAGLVSLAQHCLTLAQAAVPAGSHLHLTDSVELEPGSGDLIIERAADDED